VLRSTVDPKCLAERGWSPSQHKQTETPICHKPRAYARRPFVVTPYVPGVGGALVPAIPDVCPLGGEDGNSCKISTNHFRERTTGPCHPVAVVRCRPHGCAFTLYPPAHVPYGRQAIAPTEFPSPPEKLGGLKSFSETFFGAALDAARGIAWPREAPGGSSRWWGKQGRHLLIALLISGAAPDLSAALRVRMASALQVENLLLLDSAARVNARPGYQSRGRAVRDVLERLVSDGAAGTGNAASGVSSLLRRIYTSGYLAGVWGEPREWDSRINRLRRWAFQPSGTGPPRHRRTPRKASTNPGHGGEAVRGIGSAQINSRSAPDDFAPNQPS
jgi:hypothetical protein